MEDRLKNGRELCTTNCPSTKKHKKMMRIDKNKSQGGMYIALCIRLNLFFQHVPVDIVASRNVAG